MKNTLHLNIVDSHHEIFHGKVSEITVSGSMGGLTFLVGHAPFISSLKAGETHYTTAEGNLESIFVSGGIVEVQPNLVTILADTIIRSDELDAEEAKKSIDRAKEKIKGIKVGSDAYQDLQREMQIMKAMIEMSKTTRKLRMKHY